ncbi:oxidoreductase, partial [Pseudomonas aeruginosa]|nr:oxidoreductase [Pseudomonas aeruginosa]
MNNLIRLRDGVAEVCRDDPWQLLRELPDALPPGPLLLPLGAATAPAATRRATHAGVAR